MLELAIKATLPLIHVRTDDTINVEEVLTEIAGEKVMPLVVPPTIAKISDLHPQPERVYYTSNECASLGKLYAWCVQHEKCIIFVNTEKSVLQFDGGQLYPPKVLVKNLLNGVVTEDEADGLLPCFGGLTLKDVGEIAQLTMTRDQSLTAKGVNDTRRGYAGRLRGIQQIDTNLDFYMPSQELEDYMAKTGKFFLLNVHPSLTPRGLLFDGIPGTGKTLASKRIASLFNVPLYHIDLGSMMGKYVGDSEGNLNAALTQIDLVEPCVVIFDEVEKIFQQSHDSGVTSRLLSQLLWWLQEHKSRVFTVMTTNKVENIPDELHREGRIDQTMVFMGLKTYVEGRLFAQKAFESMAKAVGLKETAESKKQLEKEIKLLFADNTPVPQVRVTKVVSDIIREIYLNKEVA